jgi:hypothetical protein
MFVHDIGVEFAEFGPGVFEVIVFRAGAGTGDELNLGMLLLEHRVELGVALDVGLLPVLVADAEHLHLEWFGMTHRGALGAPRTGDRAVGKFDEVNRVLNEGFN